MEHFNELTPAEAELLALLAEECGECVQAIGKILRHGLESFSPYDMSATTNREMLTKEMGDIRAAMIRLCETGVVQKEAVHAAAETKLHKLNKWMHHNYDRERESL